jgi:hypothetical protein
MTMKFSLGTLVALSLSGAASAVTLNPKGLGQVLIYPYYTVNKNQDTLISVANTTDVGKVARVIFVEGINGREVLDFRLFLSAHDVWTAAISQTADDGGAMLTSGDTSCTYPLIPATGVLFRSSWYDGTGAVVADSGPQGITRTREGSIEVITAGDIVPGSPTEALITHVQNGSPGAGEPPGCAQITSVSIQDDVTTPTNGIYGAASIVNVGEGTFFAYNADAIAGFTDFPLISPAYGMLGPTLQDANSADATDGVARAYLFNANGRPVTADYAYGADAVSAVFMSDAIYNEYLVDASLGANTDWVVTFPTKRYYVDTLYGLDVPHAPFVQAFQDGRADVAVLATIYDREEGFYQLPTCCIDPPVVPPMLPYQVNVIPFVQDAVPSAGAPSGVFGSLLTAVNIPPYDSAGAVTLDLTSGDGGLHQLPGGIDTQGGAVVLRGLPVTGFMSYNIINTQAQPGRLANYGGAFPHRATMSCIGPAAECTQTNTATAP